MVNYVNGNLLDSNVDYICHQVNCQGVMGSGIARQIRERWPEVYDRYARVYRWHRKRGFEPNIMLGSIDIIPIIGTEQAVINMYSQDNCGYDGNRYTSYDAFENALRDIKESVPKGKSIGFPKNIGCGLGGGNWKIVSIMIEEILGADYNVCVYEYDPEVK